MNIVLEGPDGGGKTTLAAVISRATGMQVIPGEGPAKSPEEINDRVRRMLDLNGVIFDRHPVVSSGVYEVASGRGWRPTLDLKDAFYDQLNLIIYCRPDLEEGQRRMTFDPDEDPRQVRLVRRNYDTIHGLYDQWATRHAHYIYRIGDNRLDIMNSINGHRLGAELQALAG